MTSKATQSGRTLFWGLMRAQLISTVVFAIVVALLAGMLAGMAAAWGGLISLIAYAWGGFQVWLHPGNRVPRRMASAAIRAEVGKIAIMLLLFWLTFAKVPQTRDGIIAMVLLLGFLLAQIVGWIQVARLESRSATGHDGQDD